MAVVPLQSSNVFSYTFSGQGNTHFNYLVAGNNNPVLNIGGQSWTIECWLKPTGNYSNYNNIFVKRPLGVGTTPYQGYIRETSGFVGMRFGSASYDSANKLMSNTWNHVAWVFNQGANARIFVNGINVATAAVTSISNSDSQFTIGLYPSENSQYFGDISNFRIVLGQALYSGERFDVSTFPMQLPNNSIGPHVGGSNVAASLTGNVVLLTCNDQVIKSNGNTIINGTSTNSDISVNGFVHPHAVDTNELQHYSFANFSPSRTANSAQTSGSFMLTTDSANLNIPSGDFTIECWAYTTTNVASSGGGDIINKGGAHNIAWPSFAITVVQGNVYFAGSNTNARMDIGGDGSNGVGGNVHRGFIGTWTPNTWNHIAIVRTGTTYNGYLNGVLGYTETTANTPYNSTGRGIVMLGKFQNASNTWTAGGVSFANLNGYIADARITRRALYPANTNFTPPNTPLQLVPTTVFLLKGPGNPVDAAGSVTISSNGTGTLSFSTNNPYTANAIANTDETTLSTLNNATGRRQERIYDKLDTAEFTMSVPIFPELGRRQERIYDKLDTAEFAMSGAIFLELGRRQERIYDKLDIAEYITSVPLYDALGGRQNRIYNKFDTAIYAYIPIGTGDGTGGGSANIEYEFWS